MVTLPQRQQSRLPLSDPTGDGAGLVTASQFGYQDVGQYQRQWIYLASIASRIGQLAQILL